MEDTPLCPPYWPHSLWHLHFAKMPFKRRWPGPINRPADVDALLASLEVHTASYLMADEKLAAEIRSAAIKNMMQAIKNMEG